MHRRRLRRYIGGGFGLKLVQDVLVARLLHELANSRTRFHNWSLFLAFGGITPSRAAAATTKSCLTIFLKTLPLQLNSWFECPMTHSRAFICSAVKAHVVLPPAAGMAALALALTMSAAPFPPDCSGSIRVIIARGALVGLASIASIRRHSGAPTGRKIRQGREQNEQQ